MIVIGSYSTCVNVLPKFVTADKAASSSQSHFGASVVLLDWMIDLRFARQRIR